MQQKLQAAKDAFASKRFKEARIIISEIIESNEYKQNHKLYFKLAEISQRLSRFHDAEKYYKRCILLDPDNDKFLFQYAKFMELQHRYEAAKQFYKQCLNIDDSRACVNYRLANLLMRENDDKNNGKIEYLLQRSIDLQPAIAKYHYALGIHSQEMGKLNKANTHYRIALELVDTQDFEMLYKYYQFLMHEMKDKYKALEYLQIAAGLNENIQNEYLEFKASLDEADSKQSKPVKLVIYEFESIISYWNLTKSVDGNIQNLNKMSLRELENIFGKYDRIQALKQHFANILARGNIEIVIISFTKSEIMIQALERLKLYQYISNVIGRDKSSSLLQRNSKIDDIIKLKDANKIYTSDQVLYIDCDPETVENVSSECFTYFVDNINSKPFFGPTPEDLVHIECIIHNRQYNPSLIRHRDPEKSLNALNSHLLRSIICEINKSINDEPISLPAMQYAQTHSESDREYQLFIEFGVNFDIVVRAARAEEWWTCGHILRNYLLPLAQDSPELLRRYARCLSMLRHTNAAKNVYLRALDTNPNSYRTALSYSYHLLIHQQYQQAKQWFYKTIELNGEEDLSCSLCVGLARTLEALNEVKDAEYYYQYAIDAGPRNTCIVPAHFNYASLLMKAGRLEEAKTQCEICIHYEPHRSVNYRKLSDVLFRMNDFDGCKYYRKLGQDIDIKGPMEPTFARHGKLKNNHDMHMSKHEMKSSINDNKNCWQVEFDKFWFDDIGIVTPLFNGYYDRIIECAYNDIRCVLFDGEFERNLREEVGIRNKGHFDLIMNKIEERRIMHGEFREWLGEQNLLKKFGDIFESNAIYTREDLWCKYQQLDDGKGDIQSIANSAIKQTCELYNIV